MLAASGLRCKTGIGELKFIAPSIVSGDDRLLVKVRSGSDEFELAVRSPNARLVEEKSIEAVVKEFRDASKLSFCEKTSESPAWLRPSLGVLKSFTASAMALLSK